MSVIYTRKVEAYCSAAWRDITADVVGFLNIDYGIEGAGPTDIVSGTGVLKFQLNNSAVCSGGVMGYYSPSNTNCRSGWKPGILVRVTYTHSAVNYVKFYGKVIEIKPVTGSTGRRTVDVICYDFMRDLSLANVRDVDLAVNKTEAELLTSILAALPTASQPLSTSFDTGLDTYPFAFDNLGAGAKALGVMKDVVVSSFGFLVMKGDGTLVYTTRRSRNVLSTAYSFSDTAGDILELEVPSVMDNVFNDVRVTIHPKDVDATPTIVLARQSGTIQILVNQIVTVWAPFTDESNRDRPVGGYGVISPLVATTDYLANSAADGSGTNMTADLATTSDVFASGVNFTLANVGATTMYVTFLQIRGKGVYDNSPQTYEASSVQAYGERPLELNLQYQNDAQIGQQTANYVESIYNSLLGRIDSITIHATKSDALMVQALTREPGDKISISESVSGIVNTIAFIQKVGIEDRPGGMVTCRWQLAPASPYAFWRAGITGASEAGTTTTPGF